MSGLLKGIGKIFKKVVRVVKKIALPALAIGAVVLTGGAAIGALPALSSTIGSLGLSTGLTSVLTTAAQGATMGALTSAVTGGNIIKGATTGLIAGGALGGISQAIKPATGLAGAGGGGGTAPVIGASKDAAMLGQAGSTLGSTAAATGGGLVPAAAAPGLVSTAPAAGGGGLMGFMNQNPLVASQMLQGLGGGLMAGEQAKEERRTLKRLGENYSGYSGLVPEGASEEFAGAPIGKIAYDRATGRIYSVKS
ncbi:hypothetical protein KFK14_13000 [Sphingobium phenoxybenzoativorans]|uniref:Uncharacterized protein n=1 Tax=Sphingobium phenoxybenzoativorans TaxID=1592790 RepID=A0A975K358_9SPHN|nr:hypothetical protein [Sphingobium phenoxybenzoativorans]QUT04065.1 hypothetical protein KFK14_13000 [Sphingobium phenoxybenzoativorans]